MSTTTSARSTPAMDHVHVLPRIRPPPPLYHVPSRTRLSSTSSNGSNSSGASRGNGSGSGSLKRLDSRTSSGTMIDPFLAQYMKPAKSDSHELYFRALNKQVRVKSFDYYQKYLNHNKLKYKVLPSVPTIRQSAFETRRPDSSPLQKEITLDLVEQEADYDMTEEERTSSRRRRYTSGDSPKSCPPKKMHSSLVLLETLPREFMECSMDHLINLITRMLQSLINLNDRSVPDSISHPHAPAAAGVAAPEEKKKLLTRYHSRTPPAISIHTYLSRLTKFNNFTQATMLTTIYYIDLLSHNFQPYFTLNSWTVHRFLLVATMLAQKSLEDFFYTNDHYAKVGGVALTELNCLELDFLNRVDWKVVPAKQLLNGKTSIKHSKEVLGLYYVQLVSLMGQNVLDQNNIVYSLEEEQAAPPAYEKAVSGYSRL